MARSFRHNCRGQVIVITALLVAVILLTTAMYVIEVKKNTPIVKADDGVPIDSYRTSVKSTLVSALSNVSGGGVSTILDSDLAELKSVILAHSYESQLTLDYSLLDSDGYSDGILVSWGSTGDGVSSVYATISCSSSSPAGSSDVSYVVNVTSSVHVSGEFTRITNDYNQVDLVVALDDEEGSMLAESFVFSYYNSTQWVNASSPSITDLGDGTYTVTFFATTGLNIKTLDVSTVCLDTRGISVGANLTCSRAN